MTNWVWNIGGMILTWEDCRSVGEEPVQCHSVYQSHMDWSETAPRLEVGFMTLQ